MSLFSLPTINLQKIPGTPYFRVPKFNPTDCATYPNSPFCPGSPANLLTQIPITQIHVSTDSCYTGIIVTPVIGFQSFPDIHLLYRNNNCTVPPISLHNSKDYPYIPPQQSSGIYIWVSGGEYLSDDTFNSGANHETNHYIWDYEYTGVFEYNNETGNGTVGIKFNRTHTLVDNSGTTYSPHVETFNGTMIIVNEDLNPTYPADEKGDNNLAFTVDTYANIGTVFCTFGYRKTRLFAENNPNSVNRDSTTTQTSDSTILIQHQEVTWTVTEIDATFYFQTPPPPPLCIEDNSCMSGCNNDSNTDQLLKLLLQRIGDFPQTLPNSFLTKNGKQPLQNFTVNNLVEFIAWNATRLDEVLGEFEINIQIQDTDPTKKGNQSETIRLPNLAEAIAEIFTLQIQGSIQQHLTNQMMVKTLAEIAQVKQTDFKSYSAIMALIDYVGFNHVDTNQDMPLSITPNATGYDNFLESSNVTVSTIGYQDTSSLQAILQNLMQAAAIIRAVHFRKIPDDDVLAPQQMLSDLKKMVGNSDLTKAVSDYLVKIQKAQNGTTNNPN